VLDALRARSVLAVLMDGDELREALASTTDYSAATRLELAYKYSRLARLVARQGVTVVVCTVALFHEIHQWNRIHLPGYFEVYLKVPIEELRRRDSKGVYRRHDQGELENVAGIDIAVEEPLKPDLTLKYNPHLDPEAELRILMMALDREGPLR